MATSASCTYPITKGPSAPSGNFGGSIPLALRWLRHWSRPYKQSEHLSTSHLIEFAPYWAVSKRSRHASKHESYCGSINSSRNWVMQIMQIMQTSQRRRFDAAALVGLPIYRPRKEQVWWPRILRTIPGIKASTSIRVAAYTSQRASERVGLTWKYWSALSYTSELA